MAILATQRALNLRVTGNRDTFTSPKIAIDPLTDGITIRIARPTTLAPLAWSAADRLRITIVLVIDGVEHRCTGQTSGGIRVRPSDGAEASEYSLTYRLTVLNDGGVIKRIGQTRQSECAAFVIAQLLDGDIETALISAETTESPAPLFPIHNSVAFQAVTDAQETNGDGILSLSHTSTGSNLAVFAGVGWFSDTVTSTGVTYGGSGMTELWDINHSGGQECNAGYRLAGQATGAQTVTSTLSGAPIGDHGLGVISMTGVDQATPVGTHNVAEGSSTTPTVTVASVGVDDMVVDNVFSAYADGAAPTVGADQTSRYVETITWQGSHLTGSTQLGTSGGVMSWSCSSRRWVIGAVAFKPAAAAGIKIPVILNQFRQRAA